VQLPPYVNLEAPRNAQGAAPVVSIVIPAYNEAERILPHLRECIAFLRKRGEPFELLVVDDGSRDATAQVVREEARQTEELGLVTYGKNHGKGHAVRVGMLAARGAWRLFTDADGSTPIAEIERLLKAAKEGGCDVAVGSRALPAPGIQRQIKAHRWFIGQVFKTVRQVLLKVNVHDSQCGFKLFSGVATEKLYPVSRVDGFAFDVELLYLASLAGYRVVEVPVNWHDVAGTRVSFWRDPLKMIADMWRVRRLHGPGTFK
jgi:dolichyl-phosphate beta-glucosyltransferase